MAPKGGRDEPRNTRPQCALPQRSGALRWGPNCGAQNLALFCPSPATTFILSSLSWGSARVSHDSPRAQTWKIEGPGLQKHHHNSTRRPPREGIKKEKCGGRGQKKSDIFGGPAESGPVQGGPGEGPNQQQPTTTTTYTNTKNGLAKNGLAQTGLTHIGQTTNLKFWPKMYSLVVVRPMTASGRIFCCRPDCNGGHPVPDLDASPEHETQMHDPHARPE